MMKISSPAAQVVSAAPSYAARSTTNSNVRSCCVRRVDGPLAEQAKPDAFGAQIYDQRKQVPHRSSEIIQSPNHQDIAALEDGEAFGQTELIGSLKSTMISDNWQAIAR